MTQTKLVAILNITPDSYSDGVLYIEHSAVIKQIKHLLKSEPAVIDIGAISTRPKSISPSINEEKARFDAVLSAIISALDNSDTQISIDSYNFETLQYLMTKLPIAWINDQSGYRDERIVALARNTAMKLVVMHNITIHVDPQKIVSEELDVTLVVKDWLLARAEYLMSQGIKKEQIILDPGIGFGKNAHQSWKLIREAKIFVDTGYPILYGHSRKSFMNLVTDKAFAERDLETSVVSLYLANQGVEYLRVHDVESNARGLKLEKYLRV